MKNGIHRPICPAHKFRKEIYLIVFVLDFICGVWGDYRGVITNANSCMGTDISSVEVIDVRCGNNLDKVSLCHLPPGNPQNAQQLCIDANSVPTHLTNHGDYLG